MSGSTNVGSIHYDLGLDTSKFDKASAAISNKLKSVGEKMTSVGKTATVGLTLPIVAGAAIAVKAASDLNENINKVQVAFKKSAKEVMDWSKTSIKAMGLAQSSALGAASLFGDMATSMGLSTQKASKMSTSLVQLGADLASFKNISFEEAQTALAGVFTGETESLKRLGIVMTEVNLLEYAKKQGITKTIQEMSQAEKVQLRYNYIMEKTKNAQGDFIRTGGGTANQIRITQEKFKELSATLGARLLPIANKVLAALQKFMDRISSLTPTQQDWLLRILAVTAALGPLLIILGKLTSAIGTLIPLFANPVFLVIAAVLAVIAGAAYLVYKNWDKIKPTVDKLIVGFKIFWNIIKPLRDFVVNQFLAAWRDLKAAFDNLKKTIDPYMPQIMLLGKVLLGLSVFITATLIVTLVAFTVVVARVIGWLVKLIAFVVKTSETFARWQRSVIGAIIQLDKAARAKLFSLVGFFMSIPGKILRSLGNPGRLLYFAGQMVIQGFLNGMGSLAGQIGAYFLNRLPKFIKVPFMKALGIHSPSKVFESYGRNITQGLVNGVSQGRTMINQSISKLSNATKPPTSRTGMTMANNSSFTVNGNINIDNKNDADYLLSRINRNQTLSSLGVAPIGGV